MCIGALCIFIETDICNGVTVLKKKREFLVWLKLNKPFFVVERDIYVGSVYIPPEGSSYWYMIGCQPDEPLASLVTTNRIINVYGCCYVTQLFCPSLFVFCWE